jgi:hypothetical protein
LENPRRFAERKQKSWQQPPKPASVASKPQIFSDAESILDHSNPFVQTDSQLFHGDTMATVRLK